MEFGTQEFPFPEQPAERQLVTHPAHRVGGIPRQSKTLRKQRGKLDSRIVHRQYGIQVAADLPQNGVRRLHGPVEMKRHDGSQAPGWGQLVAVVGGRHRSARSEEHTSELQSQSNLVCRLLLEKKNTPD